LPVFELNTRDSDHTVQECNLDEFMTMLPEKDKNVRNFERNTDNKFYSFMKESDSIYKEHRSLSLKSYEVAEPIPLKVSVDVDSIALNSVDLVLNGPYNLYPVLHYHDISDNFKETFRGKRVHKLMNRKFATVGTEFGTMNVYLVFPNNEAIEADVTHNISSLSYEFRRRFYDNIVRPAVDSVLEHEIAQFPLSFDNYVGKNRDGNGSVRFDSLINLSSSLLRSLVVKMKELAVNTIFGDFFFHYSIAGIKLQTRVELTLGAVFNVPIKMEETLQITNEADICELFLDIGLDLSPLKAFLVTLLWKKEFCIKYAKQFTNIKSFLQNFATMRDACGVRGRFKYPSYMCSFQLYHNLKTVTYNAKGGGFAAFSDENVFGNKEQFQGIQQSLLNTLDECNGSFGLRMEWRVPFGSVERVMEEIHDNWQAFSNCSNYYYAIPTVKVTEVLMRMLRHAVEFNNIAQQKDIDIGNRILFATLNRVHIKGLYSMLDNICVSKFKKFEIVKCIEKYGVFNCKRVDFEALTIELEREDYLSLIAKSEQRKRLKVGNNTKQTLMTNAQVEEFLLLNRGRSTLSRTATRTGIPSGSRPYVRIREFFHKQLFDIFCKDMYNLVEFKSETMNRISDLKKMELKFSERDINDIFIEYTVVPTDQQLWDRLLNLYFPVDELPVFHHPDWNRLQPYYRFLEEFHRTTHPLEKQKFHELISTIEYLPTGSETTPVWQYEFRDLERKTEQSKKVKLYKKPGPDSKSQYPSKVRQYNDNPLHTKLAFEKAFKKPESFEFKRVQREVTCVTPTKRKEPVSVIPESYELKRPQKAVHFQSPSKKPRVPRKVPVPDLYEYFYETDEVRPPSFKKLKVVEKHTEPIITIPRPIPLTKASHFENLRMQITNFKWRNDIPLCRRCNLQHPEILPPILMDYHLNPNFKDMLFFFYYVLPRAKVYPIKITNQEREDFALRILKQKGKGKSIYDKIQEVCEIHRHQAWWNLAMKEYPTNIVCGYLGQYTFQYIKEYVLGLFKKTKGLQEFCSIKAKIEDVDKLAHYIATALIPFVLCDSLTTRTYNHFEIWEETSLFGVVLDNLDEASQRFIRELIRNSPQKV
jgi:hypothetical protein